MKNLLKMYYSSALVLAVCYVQLSTECLLEVDDGKMGEWMGDDLGERELETGRSDPLASSEARLHSFRYDSRSEQLAAEERLYDTPATSHVPLTHLNDNIQTNISSQHRADLDIATTAPVLHQFLSSERHRSVQLPNTSRRSVQLPHTSIRSVQLPHTSRRSVQLPHTSIRSVKLPRTSRGSVQLPITSRLSVQLPYTSRRSVQLPHTSTRSVPHTSSTKIKHNDSAAAHLSINTRGNVDSDSSFSFKMKICKRSSGLGTILTQERILESYVSEELHPNTQVGDIVEEYGLKRKYNESILSRLRFGFLTLPQGQRQYFSVDETTGVIRTTSRIDREELCPRMDFCFVKFDVAVQPIEYFQIIKVRVEILDINDNAPQFPRSVLQYNLSEDAEPGMTFLIPSAEDLDSSRNGVVDYELMPSSDVFDLTRKDMGDGSAQLRLRLRQRVDREITGSYQFNVFALDGGEPVRSGILLVNITVTDVNDHVPQFDNATKEVRVREDLRPGSVVFRVRALDGDSGLNGEVIYYFTKDTLRDYGRTFTIRPETGIVSTIGKLDYEERSEYLLYIIASDRGESLVHTAQMVLNVKVEDINDNAPVIHVNIMPSTPDLPPSNPLSPFHSARSLEAPQVREESEPGIFVAHIRVEDPDGERNGKFHCYITNSNLFELRQLYSSEFKVVTMVTFDRERQDRYEFSVTCRDNGQPSLTTVMPVTVHISDINDNSPQFLQDSYQFIVAENSPSGSSIGRVTATDRDSGRNGEVVYKILDERTSRSFQIDSLTGIITSRTSLDHETTKVHVFSVVAQDLGADEQRSSSVLVHLTVADVDDEGVEFSAVSYTFAIEENLPPGSEVGVVKAVDRDSASNGGVSYKILYPAEVHRQEGQLTVPFAIHRSSGRITTVQSLDREVQASYKLLIVATSTLGGLETSSTSEIILDVADANDHQPVFEFPGESGEQVLVSALTPRGFLIARARATDKDIGLNSELTYSIKDGSDSYRIFQVDSKSGEIRVAEDLTELDVDKIRITLVAQDGGLPPLSATSELTIEIRPDLPAPQTSRALDLLASEDLAVILALTLAAILVIISIVIALIILARRRRCVKRYSGGMGFEPTTGVLGAEWAISGDMKEGGYEKYSSVMGSSGVVGEGDMMEGRQMNHACSNVHQLENESKIGEDFHTDYGTQNKPVVGFVRDQLLKKFSPNSDSNSDSGKGPSSEDGDHTNRPPVVQSDSHCRQAIGHTDWQPSIGHSDLNISRVIGHTDLNCRPLIGQTDASLEARVRLIARQSSAEYLKARQGREAGLARPSGDYRDAGDDPNSTGVEDSRVPFLSLEDVRPDYTRHPLLRGGRSVASAQGSPVLRAPVRPLPYSQTLDTRRSRPLGSRVNVRHAGRPPYYEPMCATLRFPPIHETVTSLSRMTSLDRMTSQERMTSQHFVPLSIELSDCPSNED